MHNSQEFLLSSSSPSNWQQCRRDTAHSPLRRKEIILCRRIPRIRDINLDAERIEIALRLRRQRVRRGPETENQHV